MKPVRKHNCEAETNLVQISVEWAEDGRHVLITTWGCRKCRRTWTTEYDPEKVEQERLERLRADVAKTAAQMAEERRLELEGVV
jgi:hypothetical protein